MFKPLFLILAVSATMAAQSGSVTPPVGTTLLEDQTLTCARFHPKDNQKSTKTVQIDRQTLVAMQHVGIGAVPLATPETQGEVVCPISVIVAYIPGSFIWQPSDAKYGVYYDWYPSYPFIEDTVSNFGTSSGTPVYNFYYPRNLSGTGKQAMGRTLMFGKTADGNDVNYGNGVLQVTLEYFTVLFRVMP